MATGWTITVGYNSGYSSSTTHKSANEMLGQAAAKYRDDISIICSDGLVNSHWLDECDLPEDDETLEEWVTIYLKSAIKITDESVHIMASGTNPSRAFKEVIARAYCRRIVDEMHRFNIDVNMYTD